MRRRAFSLIEILVVLAVIGIALGAVAPAFTRRGPAEREPAVAEIRRVLDRARATALRAAREATVTIDPVAHRVWVRTASASSTPFDTTFLVMLPANTELQAATPRVRFTFELNARATGDQLIVASPTARTAITVDPWTGDVHAASVGSDARR